MIQDGPASASAVAVSGRPNIRSSWRSSVANALVPLGAIGSLCAISPIGEAAHVNNWAAGLALLTGIAIALGAGNPYASRTKAWTPILLQLGVIGLGFGMDLTVVLRIGLHGIAWTMTEIALTFTLGAVFARMLAIPRDVGLLVTVGTAICGGSAIAAVAPVIRARDLEVSIALGTVFLLNAIALLVFPILGHAVGLDQRAFGLWAALAVHDTSSVIGAATQYGPTALVTATTLKLTRALWIVPMTLAIGALRSREAAYGDEVRPPAKRPWFILGFLGAAALVTVLPQLANVGHAVSTGARAVLVLTLFLVGANVSHTSLVSVGLRPLLYGVLLWAFVASLTLVAIGSGLLT